MERKEKRGFLSFRFLFRDPEFPYSKDSEGQGAFPKMPEEQYNQYFFDLWPTIITPTLLFLIVEAGDENYILIKKRVYFISNWIVYKRPCSGQFWKSRFFAHANAVFVTCIRRPHCSRSCVCLSLLFSLVSSGHPWSETKPYVILCGILLSFNAIHQHYKEITCTSYCKLILGRLLDPCFSWKVFFYS